MLLPSLFFMISILSSQYIISSFYDYLLSSTIVTPFRSILFCRIFTSLNRIAVSAQYLTSFSFPLVLPFFYFFFFLVFWFNLFSDDQYLLLLSTTKALTVSKRYHLLVMLNACKFALLAMTE